MGLLALALLSCTLAWADSPSAAEPADAPVRLRVEPTEMEARAVPRIDIPPGVSATGPNGVTCATLLWVDAEGRVEKVVRQDCSDLLWAEVEPKLAEARFRPHRVDGTAVPVEFTQVVRFYSGSRGRHPDTGKVVRARGAYDWFALASPLVPLAGEGAQPPFGLGLEFGTRGAGRFVSGLRFGVERWAPAPAAGDEGGVVRTLATGFLGVDLLSTSSLGWGWNGGLVPQVGVGVGMVTDHTPVSPVRRAHLAWDAGGEVWLGRRLGEQRFLRLAVWTRWERAPDRVQDARIAPMHLGFSLGIGEGP